MTRARGLKLNPRLLFFAKGFVEVKMLNAFVVLFYLARGVTVEQVFYLTAIWSLATLIFEVPSGYLADRIGRKWTLLVGVLLMIAANVVNFNAYGFLAFGLVAVLLSASDSMFSGSEEALLYDTLKERRIANRMNRYFGKLESARNFVKIFFPVAGAIIAQDLLEWQFHVVIAVNIVLGFVALVCVLMLTEAKHEVDVQKGEVSLFKTSLKTIWHNPFLFRASLNRTLVFIGSLMAWRVYQPYLSDLGVSVLALAVFYFLLQVGGFLTKWFSDELTKTFGVARYLTVSAVLVAVFSVAAVFIQLPAVTFVLLLLTVVLAASRTPMFSRFLNDRIESHVRATTLSNLYVLKSMIDLPLFLLAGFVARTNPANPLWIVAALAIIATFIFPVRSKDLV